MLFLIAVSQANHNDYDCFGCAILTHRGDGDVLYAADDKMKLTDFTQPFGSDRCPSLASKPKLFFIQVSCYIEKVAQRAFVCFNSRSQQHIGGINTNYLIKIRQWLLKQLFYFCFIITLLH